jgi:hypothetical protein
MLSIKISSFFIILINHRFVMNIDYLKKFKKITIFSLDNPEIYILKCHFFKILQIFLLNLFCSIFIIFIF